MPGARVPGVSDAPAADGQLDTIRAGYAFAGAALDLGAAVSGGVAHPDAPVRIPLAVLNRHGLVAGATGTGKTKTLQLMAEQLSAQGVPVFLADIKGDLSGMASAGEAGDRVTSRAGEVGQTWSGTAYPTEFLSLGGLGRGVPVRATVTSFGPTLLAKVLGLNATQESSLGLVFHYADRSGLALLDLKDLRAVIGHLTSAEGKADLKELGGLSTRHGRRHPAQPHRPRRPGGRRLLRRARARHRRPAAHRRGRPRHRHLPRAPRRAGPAPAVLDLPHVDAGRPVPRPARGR